METAELPAVGVAANGDVHGGEAASGVVLHLAGKEYHTGTGAEDWQAGEDGVAEGLEKAFIVHDAKHGSALTAGNDEAGRVTCGFQATECVPIVKVTDEVSVCADLKERLLMFSKRSLQSEDGYLDFLTCHERDG